ncbi:MAG: hypothetical protein ABJG47_07160 [Ekhidna sp.]
MKMIKNGLLLFSIATSTICSAQVNTTQEGNYKVRASADRYFTQFQNGYVVIKDGTRFDGQISLFGSSYRSLSSVKIKTGELTYDFYMRSLKEFGLSDNLINDTPDAFDWFTMDKVKLMGDPNAPAKPSNKRKAVTNNGYVVTKSGAVYQGKMTVIEVKKKVESFSLKTKDKQKLKFEASELSNFGVGEYGTVTNAAVAEESTSVTSAIENEEEPIDDADAYDPIDASFLATKTTDESVSTNGYVITSAGEKIEGAVSVTAPPKIWFATDVTLTTPSGVVKNYANDGSLQKVVFTVNGQEKEFVNYENEYVEILHREGKLIHFRNPHPTTSSMGGDLADALTGAAMESADRELREAGGSVTKTGTEGDTDWTSEEIIKLYAKEYILLNEENGRYAMYIPGKNYRQIKGELMGSAEYLSMDKDSKNVLRKMGDPRATMQFLNAKLYTK